VWISLVFSLSPPFSAAVHLDQRIDFSPSDCTTRDWLLSGTWQLELWFPPQIRLLIWLSRFKYSRCRRVSRRASAVTGLTDGSRGSSRAAFVSSARWSDWCQRPRLLTASTDHTVMAAKQPGPRKSKRSKKINPECFTSTTRQQSALGGFGTPSAHQSQATVEAYSLPAWSCREYNICVFTLCFITPGLLYMCSFQSN